MIRSPLASLVLAATACGEATGPVREISGEQLYQQYCARCHGIDGHPVPEQPQARSLADRRIVDGISDEAMMMVVQRGRPPGMPAFGDQFTEASLSVLVAYVRTLSGSRGSHARADEQ
jgi:mono/diheme cytochrome c family protein